MDGLLVRLVGAVAGSVTGGVLGVVPFVLFPDAVGESSLAWGAGGAAAGFVAGWIITDVAQSRQQRAEHEAAQAKPRESFAPQVVGAPCCVCGVKLIFAGDGAACPTCGAVRHRDCAAACPRCPPPTA